MKRKVVKWVWEDAEAQKTFTDWVGFPDDQKTSEELNKIVALSQITPPMQVLDLGCGTGRHALEMAARGYRVVGMDVARNFLAQAKRKAARRHLNVEFRLQRGSKLKEEGVYDFALAFNHTIGFMADEELRQHFNRVCIALKPSGRLLLILAGPKLFPNQSDERTKNWSEKNGRFILSEKYLENGYRIELDILIDPDADEIIEFRERQRAFSFQEVFSLLHSSGFQRIDAMRDLDGNPATETEFGVFLCHKPPAQNPR